MKYVKLIYNPMAGSRVFPSRLDYFIKTFQSKGYDVRIRRTESETDYDTYLVGKDLTHCEGIIVAGGDGSVNRIVNSMIKNNIDVPIGVIPAGTANDFAMHLKIPNTFTEAIEKLSLMKTKKVDVGRVNDKYFINVCSGGLLTNISQNIDTEFKNTLGKLAYYIKGVQQLPKFKKINFRITVDNQIIEENLYLFLILNGSSAGGFNKIGKDANIDDGKFDFVGIKACQINEMPTLFTKILLGEHLNDKNVLFLQGEKMLIECLDENELCQESDIDGEIGPGFPLDIEVLNKRIKVIVGE